MNKIQFDNLLKQLINIYDEIELDLIKNVLEQLGTYKSVQGSLDWYLEKLADIGTLDRDNLKVIKGNKKKIEKVLKEIAYKSGTHIEDLDTLNLYFEQGKISVNPKDLFESVSINNLINEALKDTEDIMRLINTKAIESTKESYMKILNKAYVETASGVYSYEESIKKGIKEFAKEGIKGATYESGKSLTIETVVRRDVVTRMNKLTGDAELEHAKELNTNLVYVDQHLGARIRTKYMKHDYEAHVEWQGKKYMLEGSNSKYDNFYEKTGYGEMLGLKGINCYHDFRPTWEWETIESVIDEVKNAEKYEQLEKQRSFERKIRELKRRKLASKDIDPEEYMKVNHKLKKTNKQFDKWLKDNNLTRDYNREFVEKTKVKEPKVKYEDLTEQLRKSKGSSNSKERRLNYSIDSEGNVHTDFFFEKDLIEEIDFQLKLEEATGYKVFLNPKTYTQNVKTPDYWIEDAKELWDLKGIDGDSDNIIDNILNKACKKMQTPNIILKQRNTPHDIDKLKNELKDIFEKKHRKKIKQVMLFDKENNVIAYYKR